MRSLLVRTCVAVLLLAGCKKIDAGADGSVPARQDGGLSGQRADAGAEPRPTAPPDAGSSSADAGSMPMDMADGGGASDSGLATPDAVPDPAPQATAPGEYTCDGCPTAGITEFQLDAGTATSQLFSGVVTGAVGNGEFYLESPGGQSIGGVIPTATDGSYSFTVPLFCGTQLLKCLWSNDQGTYVAVIQIVTADCVDADIRVTLTWDALGYDFELHLVKQGCKINDGTNDCTWTTCIGGSLDWGVVGDATDNPSKDVDNTGNYGPENIFYPQPEDGTYTVLVEHWGAGMADADGQVTINLLGEAPVVIDIQNLASHNVFTAGTIEWPSKVVTVAGDIHDCTANWSGGCLDPLP